MKTAIKASTIKAFQHRISMLLYFPFYNLVSQQFFTSCHTFQCLHRSIYTPNWG